MLLSYRETATNLIYLSGLKNRPDLIENYAKPAVAGDAFIGWLYTEEKDGFNFETNVSKKSDRYILNGHKSASTGGATCTSWIVYASTEDGQDTIAVMVKRDDPGVTVTPLKSLGLRSIGLTEVSFKDVELSEDRIIAKKDGISHAQIFINERRVTGSAWLLGRMRALIDRVIEDTLPRSRYNRPLADFDTFKSGIGRMLMAVERAKNTAYKAFAETEAERENNNFVHNPIISIAKYLSTESALEVADIAQRMTGGHGYFESFGIERFIRDFYGLVPIIGGQPAIEVEVGARYMFEKESREIVRK